MMESEHQRWRKEALKWQMLVFQLTAVSNEASRSVHLHRTQAPWPRLSYH